jgi:hypothetical protein
MGFITQKSLEEKLPESIGGGGEDTTLIKPPKEESFVFNIPGVVILGLT